MAPCGVTSLKWVNKWGTHLESKMFFWLWYWFWDLQWYHLYVHHSMFFENAVFITRWRHQMETVSALLAICAGNPPVTGAFPAQRPVTRSFDVFFDLHLNKRLGKQSWGWWCEMPSRPSWRHFNALMITWTWPIHLMMRSVLDYVTNRSFLIAWFIAIYKRACITHHIHCLMWDIITDPCPSFNS